VIAVRPFSNLEPRDWRQATDTHRRGECRHAQAIGRRQFASVWRSNCYKRAPVDTPVRLLVVDLDARHITVTTDLVEEEGIDVRTAVDASGAIDQCRLEYLDLVMINAGFDGESGATLLETIRTFRPTVRAVLMNGAQVPIRQMLRELRNEPRHVPCVEEFQHIESHAFVLPFSA